MHIQCAIKRHRKQKVKGCVPKDAGIWKGPGGKLLLKGTDKILKTLKKSLSGNLLVEGQLHFCSQI